MSGPRPIADGQEVAHVVAALRKLGFSLIRKSFNGSRYMRYGRSPFTLRVSNHDLPAEHRAANPQLLVSWTVRPPLTTDDVDTLALTIGLRFILRARDRKGLVRDNAA